jgi:hypothetical protein
MLGNLFRNTGRLLALSAFALCVFVSPCFSQNTTTVTAAVTDPTGLAYSFGTYTVSLVNTSGQQAQFGGNPNFQQVYSGSLDTNGLLSITLPSNAVITPTNPTTQWNFFICANPKQYAYVFPLTTLPCFNNAISISGTSQSITGSLTSVAIPKSPGNISAGGGTAPSVSSTLKCAAGSASGTAYTCSTSPTFVPLDGDAILFETDVANTGAVTLNVNASSAAPIKKQGGGTALLANDMLAGQDVFIIFDGVNWQMQGQIGNPSVLTVQTNVYGAFLQDFSAATMKIPQAAGFVATAASTIGLDTTNNNVHFWSNSADSINVVEAAALAANTIPKQTDATHGLLAASLAIDDGVTLKYTGTGGITTASNNAILLSDFTDANASGLQAITGLSFTLVANTAQNRHVDCNIMWSQATNVADTFGIQDVSLAPTMIDAYGTMSVAGPAAVISNEQYGVLTNLTTTTATGIVTATPTVATVNYADLHITVQQPSGVSSVLQIMVQQATAADVIVVKAGSSCHLN